MNSFTFVNIPPPRQGILNHTDYNIFKDGNLIALEQPGRLGMELRSNTGIRCISIRRQCWEQCARAAFQPCVRTCMC